jgi:hypothetical protein
VSSAFASPTYYIMSYMSTFKLSTTGPGVVHDPEHDESTPAETKIVTIVLSSCMISYPQIVRAVHV